jgi:hypothetical protein
MATVRIEVTQADIEEGQVDCEFCPIALAIKRTMLETYAIAPYVSVDEYRITIGGWYTAQTDDIQDFVEDFDNTDDPVEPFSFDLDLPDDLAGVTGATT